jgi:hypothetical protein
MLFMASLRLTLLRRRKTADRGIALVVDAECGQTHAQRCLRRRQTFTLIFARGKNHRPSRILATNVRKPVTAITRFHQVQLKRFRPESVRVQTRGYETYRMLMCFGPQHGSRCELQIVLAAHLATAIVVWACDIGTKILCVVAVRIFGRGKDALDLCAAAARAMQPFLRRRHPT